MSMSWPAFEAPDNPLELGSTDATGLFEIRNFFSPLLCKRWRLLLHSDSSIIKFSPSPRPKRNEATRTNDRFSINDSRFARSLYDETGLRELCETSPQLMKVGDTVPIGLNPNIRIYRYAAGAFFDKHYDDSIKVDQAKSEFTLLIYLSGEEDGVEGGGTAFYSKGEAIVVSLERGKAVLHRHGRECMLHEGQVVRKGIKYVLRSDILYGRA